MNVRGGITLVIAGLVACGSATRVALGQESKALFDAPVVVENVYHRINALVDLDGNGQKDAVGFWRDGDSNIVFTGWMNDGNGVLSRVWTFPSGSENAAVNLAPGNLDGDAREDFVITVGSAVYLYSSNGSVAPTLRFTANNPTAIRSLVVADFDEDGLDDIAVADSQQVRVYVNQGAAPPALQSSAPMWNPAGYPTLIEAEVDGDGSPDLAILNVTTGHSYLRLYPAPQGVIGAGQDFLLSGVTDPMPTSGDVDGDGDEDLVIFRMSSFLTLRRTGATTFTLESPVAGGPATNLVDVDADGDLDGVCCGGGGGSSAPQNTFGSIFRVSLNDGGGGFAPAFEIPGVGANHIAGAVDMDGDGDVDLVAGRCIYFSHGPLVKGPQPRIPYTGQLPSFRGPMLDFDHDGDLDVDVGSSGVFKNAADATFTAGAVSIPPPPAGTTFRGEGIPGDFDGDGDADLLVDHLTTGVGFRATRLLRNLGGAAFEDGGDATAPGERLTMMSTPRREHDQVVDLDDDGDLDVIVRQYHLAYPWPSRVWLNDGAGFFTGGQSFVGEYVTRVADFDRDGIRDALVATEGEVRLSRGSRGGAFSASEGLFFTDVSQVFECPIDIADFDQDGDLDLVAFRNAAQVLFLNDGAAHFLQTIAFGNVASAAWWVRESLVAMDVNQDGLMDFVGSPATYGIGGPAENLLSKVYVKRPGVLEFDEFTQVFKGTSGVDVDGDGDLDLRSDTYQSGPTDDVIIGADRFVLNRCFEMPYSGLKRQYGTGTAGSGGIIPLLGAATPLRPGMPREYRVNSGLGGARAYLGAGIEPREEPRRGGTLLVNPVQVRNIRLSGPPGVPGAGAWTLRLGPLPVGQAGRTYFLQAVVRDPGAPQGFSFSNGLTVTFGR